MQRGEIWFAATPGGDRPVLVLTRDPVADRIGAELGFGRRRHDKRAADKSTRVSYKQALYPEALL